MYLKTLKMRSRLTQIAIGMHVIKEIGIQEMLRYENVNFLVYI
jgi:hypothetical protein